MTLGIGAPTEAPRKYRNKPVTVDGIRFASKAEARRYSELKLLEKAGQITDLELQPKFTLHVLGPYGGALVGSELLAIGKYIADFRYLEGAQDVVEDVKSGPTETALFKWKRKHFEAEYGIKLRVIK